jgi:hypothetical protein
LFVEMLCVTMDGCCLWQVQQRPWVRRRNVAAGRPASWRRAIGGCSPCGCITRRGDWPVAGGRQVCQRINIQEVLLACVQCVHGVHPRCRHTLQAGDSLDDSRLAAWVLGQVAGIQAGGAGGRGAKMVPTSYSHLPPNSLLRALFEQMTSLPGIWFTWPNSQS